MEAAVGAANWLVGKLLAKLSDGLVAAYVASLELGHNSEAIQRQLLYTQGLLHSAQGRDVSDNPGLRGLLQHLSRKAEEAEDILDELHYFMIQDQLDGTHDATVLPEPSSEVVLRTHARHGRHAVRHTVGNCLRCFSRPPTQEHDSDIINEFTSSNPPHSTTISDNDNDKLQFKRVEMSFKIKSLIEDIHSLCDPVSDLLSKIPISSTTTPLTRPQRGSAILQDKLYGRGATFEKTIDDITSSSEALSVLPVVGPGGIGKTTFAQHVYNDTRSQEHFAVRVWICVSTDFDVLQLTKQILSSIPVTNITEGKATLHTSNLSNFQEDIAQRLKSQRFLLVLDDIWKCDSEEDWETLLAPFTKGEAKGSMIIVTTRFPKLAEMMKTVDPIELQGLESSEFFAFFEACIFGEHNKPFHYVDDLTGIAREIANKLKGSPLAAKTVGRLLRKNLSPEHWIGVLQNSEWRNQQNNDDIMSSLKISYDYLPFDIKKCFSYFSLFPENYWFTSLEINRFWIAIGVIGSTHQSDKNYLDELLDNGFLMKAGYDFSQYYVMHDLMHELSLIVSSQECLNISCLDFRADTIPQSIRHLSITIENKYDGYFLEEMTKLRGRIDIANLRSLMFFRAYEYRTAKILKDVFRETRALRVLFLEVKSLECFPPSFPKLIHLQFLKIRSDYDQDITLPRTLSRFYHLRFLDLQDWHGSFNLPKDISRLVKLRDLVAEDKLQCNVPEIGRMKCLQELRNFYVKKETVGFELGELGPLTELAGELSIYNLENVVTKGEATNAKLMSKGNLKNLRLVWGEEQPTINIDIIDALKPHSNLGALTIINHFGATGPSWLYGDIWMTRLETLILAGVSWGTLPPFGLLPHLKELALINVSNVCQLGPDYGVVIGKHFMHLKEVKLVSMPELVEWVVEPNCLFFPSLLTVVCRDCPNLCVTPFSEFSCTNLCTLIIHDCPKLSLPAMPHTTTLTDISVQIKGTEMLGYTGKALSIRGYNGDLVFHHIDKVEKLTIADAPHFLSTDLKRLKSLKEVCVKGRHSMFSEELDDRSVVFSSSIHTLILQASSVSGKLLSNSLNSFPGLSVLEIRFSYRDHVEREIQFPSCSSLRTVYFLNCQDLVLVPVKDAAGIQVISSLQSLTIRACGKLFSRWPVGGSLAIKPFPISLRELDVQGESSMKSMGLLSNLTSLTHLRLADCNNLTMDGFDPLITVNLKVLEVFNFKLYDTAPGSIAVDLISEMATATGSFQLEQLKVDSISTVLVTPICNLLATTLRTLEFCHDKSSESSTEEQEKGLQLLTSLQTLVFFNCKLHHLPGGLHRLSSLMELGIVFCDELQCLPKDGFPTSLREVSINPCSAELKDQAEKFKGRNANLRLATHSQVPGPNESVLALQSRFAQIL